jgi:hydrogenase small subunit
MHILWITAGLGCDGDSIAMTAATQPSLEDLVLGAMPGLPEVHLHHPVLAYENGDAFLESWHRAAAGRLDPFLLVVEGSIPSEVADDAGYWAAVGVDRETGQPITTCEWIDRPAPRAWGVVAIGTCAAYGDIHAMEGNPTGCMGLPDYLGWGWRSKAGLPIVCVPGCPVQPDNFMEVLLYLLNQAAGQAPTIPLDDALRPAWLFERTAHEGCDRAGYYEQGEFAAGHGRPSASSSSVAGGRWCSATSASGAGWAASAAAPMSAASASAAPCRASPTSSCRSRRCRPGRSSPRRRSRCTARRSAPCGNSPAPR